MKEFNRLMALAQIDGWGQEHELLCYIAANALNCKPSELLPDWLDETPTEQDGGNDWRAGLNRLAGFG